MYFRLKLCFWAHFTFTLIELYDFVCTLAIYDFFLAVVKYKQTAAFLAKSMCVRRVICNHLQSSSIITNGNVLWPAMDDPAGASACFESVSVVPWLVCHWFSFGPPGQSRRVTLSIFMFTARSKRGKWNVMKICIIFEAGGHWGRAAAHTKWAATTFFSSALYKWQTFFRL